MDFLKRSCAPLTDAGWAAVDDAVADVLRASLSARHIVDVDGPHGFDFSAVGLGELSLSEAESDGTRFGVRKVLPLVEVRIPFEMNIWDLDNLSRGAVAVADEPAKDAARRLAKFEEQAIYQGLQSAGIDGFAKTSDHDPLKLGSIDKGGADGLPDTAAAAIVALRAAGVEGPYAMVLGPKEYQHLLGDVSTYPPLKRVEKILGGPLLHSPSVSGGFIISQRGGDFSLCLGQDVSIGFESHVGDTVRLFITESFTFRILSPEAFVRLD